MQRDADKLKAEKKINKLDNIAVRSVEITEAWQEGGMDFITVRFLASLLDYTVSESGDCALGKQNRTGKIRRILDIHKTCRKQQLAAIRH